MASACRLGVNLVMAPLRNLLPATSCPQPPARNVYFERATRDMSASVLPSPSAKKVIHSSMAAASSV